MTRRLIPLLLLLTCTAAPVFAQAAPTSVYADATVLRWTHPAPAEVASWRAVVSGVDLPLPWMVQTGTGIFEAPVSLQAPFRVQIVAVGRDGLESAPSNTVIYWGSPACRADLNNNGQADLPDLSAVLWELGGQCP